MFKYTPPWQVLCATLEPRAQVRAGSLPVTPAPPRPRGGSRGRGGGTGMLGGKGGAAAGGHAQVKMWQPGLLLVTRGWCWGQDPQGTTAVQPRVSARLQAGGGPTELAPGWAQGGQRRCWDPRGHSGQRGPSPARWQSCPVPALGCAHIRTRRRVWCSPVPRGRWRGLCLSPTVKQAPRSLPETHSRPWLRRRHHPRAQQVPAARPQERDGCHRPRRVSRGSQCPTAGASRDLHPCPARAWGWQPGLGRARGAGSGGARGCGRGSRTRTWPEDEDGDILPQVQAQRGQSTVARGAPPRPAVPPGTRPGRAPSVLAAGGAAGLRHPRPRAAGALQPPWGCARPSDTTARGLCTATGAAPRCWSCFGWSPGRTRPEGAGGGSGAGSTGAATAPAPALPAQTGGVIRQLAWGKLGRERPRGVNRRVRAASAVTPCCLLSPRAPLHSSRLHPGARLQHPRLPEHWGCWWPTGHAPTPPPRWGLPARREAARALPLFVLLHGEITATQPGWKSAWHPPALWGFGAPQRRSCVRGEAEGAQRRGHGALARQHGAATRSTALPWHTATLVPQLCRCAAHWCAPGAVGQGHGGCAGVGAVGSRAMGGVGGLGTGH